MLFVGLADAGVTAGGSTRRGKPLPLPLMVESTQSLTGTSGPVYGYTVSLVRLLSNATTTAESANNTDTEFAFVVARSARLSCCPRQLEGVGSASRASKLRMAEPKQREGNSSLLNHALCCLHPSYQVCARGGVAAVQGCEQRNQLEAIGSRLREAP